MGRNVLYSTQLSMYDKQTGKLTPAADGNINMMRNTINEWCKHYPEDMFYILLPKELIDFDLNIRGYHTILYYNNYVVSARINRFNFPMNEFSSILKDIKIDILINDVIELTSNFKQMFNIQFNYKPKIISNIRHLDDVINQFYMFRVVEGILQSDITTILSETMLEKLKEQTKELTGQNIIGQDNVIVFEPSVSSAEISKYSSSARVFDLDKVIITFPGRLSIGEEGRTNWDKFLKAIGLLRYKRQDFEVYLTDPNNGMASKLEQGLYQENFVHTIPTDRDSFLKLLNKTDIVVSLMDIEGFGGISIREALLMNCMPIIPEVHEYINMAPDDYEFFVDSPIDVDDLENALNYAIIAVQVARRRIDKTGGVLKRRFDYVEYGKKFSIEEQFKKLLPYIGGM